MQHTPFSWRCPFCNQNATITNADFTQDSIFPQMENALGDLCSILSYIVCPNPDCKQLNIGVTLNKVSRPHAMGVSPGGAIQTWQLIPASTAKVFPDYVPAAVRADYIESCLIRDLSPKAAATLARRCLQGMIRNFWGISKPNLKLEIDELEEKVDLLTWQAIHGVRTIGNIGAHMEKDIDLIIEVDEEEAGALIGLVEILVEDWYVDRHNKQQRLQTIVDMAAEKANERKADSANQPEAD